MFDAKTNRVVVREATEVPSFTEKPRKVRISMVAATAELAYFLLRIRVLVKTCLFWICLKSIQAVGFTTQKHMFW